MTAPPRTDRIDQAARLIGMLLDDRDLRSRFRRRPEAVARAHGLDDIADELARSAGPLQTLDVRHSRSSLLGAFAAAAAESADALSLVRDLDPADGAEGARALRQAATLAGVPLPRSEPATGPRDLQAIPLRELAGDAEPAAGLEAALERYPGDDAPREEIAAWMARCARRAGLPPELPIMAALVESNLQNVDGGDRDSVGYFQMRLQFWNQGAYAGYPDRPELQMRWFVDRALEERRERDYDGPAAYGEWAADIEQCAEQYEGRYQTRLAEARALLAAAPSAPAGGDAADAGAPREQEAPEPADAAVPARPAIHDTGPVRRRGGDRNEEPDEDGDGGGDGDGSLVEKMLRIARGEVGVAETSDNDSERIREYIGAVAGMSGPVPWCACFVSWLAREAGSPLGPEGGGFAAVADVWAWAQSEDRAVPSGSGEPHAGDLIVWDANPNVHGDEHIGIVEKVLPDGRIQTIEGNSSDHVARRVYPAGEGLGYVRMP